MVRKRFSYRATIVGLALLMSALLAGQAGAFTMTVYENGTGNIDGTPITGYMSIDPGPGGLSSVLTFNLPFSPVAEGDLILHDSWEAGNPVSDVIRFLNVTGVAKIFFYSDIGDNDLADVGLPSSYLPNTLNIPEQGSEGNAWADFSPAADYNYHIVSDVPLPPSAWLLGSGLLGLVGWRRFRKS